MCNQHKTIASTILYWYQLNKRELPWRENPTPYNVWISEILLQQTQMSRGIDYYKRFIEIFPNIYRLAESDEQKLLLLWQGLGYYSRARNMLIAAREIVEKFNGKFPDEYEDIIQLKGIGDYTASAILSIAFQKKYAVVDGNVLRIIARIFLIKEAVNETETYKKIRDIVFNMMDNYLPGDFNQALMDFGALVCKPKQPLCNLCLLSGICMANMSGMSDVLPLKTNKIKRKQRYFNYIVIIDASEKIVIKKRITNDIWKGMYEFPLIETDKPLTEKQIFEELKENPVTKNLCVQTFQVFDSKAHKLTHQDIHATFIQIQCTENIKGVADWISIPLNEISSYPMHNLMRWFMKHNDYFSNNTLSQ